ncbi:hypothetical protein AAHA92_17768 [Salvia divinorum]|uniref:Myosin motor domain-containing protein n=1 Tax=Salvia divinorum TaxID=28513 RepID=A0ABD1GZV0_SALDI
MFPKSTHETFCNKLYQTFKVHKRFIKPKLSRTDFTIGHYAGEACYVTLTLYRLFVLKSQGFQVLPNVAGLFPPIAEESSKSSKFSSIGSRFKLQLQQLMETLSATDPHYVRSAALWWCFRGNQDQLFALLATEALQGSYDEKLACKKILEKKGIKRFPGYSLQCPFAHRQILCHHHPPVCLHFSSIFAMVLESKMEKLMATPG